MYCGQFRYSNSESHKVLGFFAEYATPQFTFFVGMINSSGTVTDLKLKVVS
jgi:hypothetical protein